MPLISTKARTSSSVRARDRFGKHHAVVESLRSAPVVGEFASASRSIRTRTSPRRGSDDRHHEQGRMRLSPSGRHSTVRRGTRPPPPPSIAALVPSGISGRCRHACNAGTQTSGSRRSKRTLR
jgi:hypothetical protein